MGSGERVTVGNGGNVAVGIGVSVGVGPMQAVINTTRVNRRIKVMATDRSIASQWRIVTSMRQYSTVLGECQ